MMMMWLNRGKSKDSKNTTDIKPVQNIDIKEEIDDQNGHDSLKNGKQDQDTETVKKESMELGTPVKREATEDLPLPAAKKYKVSL